MVAFFFAKLPYGISKHGAWHGGSTGREPLAQTIEVSLSGFAQQPAHSLLEQVVEGKCVIEKYLGDGVCVVRLPMADELHGGDYADTSFPYRPAVCSKAIQQAAVFVKKPCAEQVVAAQVDKVPVVDMGGVAEVEVDAALAERHVFLGVGEYLHESEEGSKAHLMVGAGDAPFEFVKAGGAPAFLDHTSCHWNLDANKLVAFAILSFAALKEARQTCHLAFVSMG